MSSREAEKMGFDVDPDFVEEVAKRLEGAIHQRDENSALLKEFIKIEE